MSWKDASNLNTVTVNACIKRGITIQLVYLPCNTIFQYIDSVQREWTCTTSYQEIYWRLLWRYAMNQMKSCEDLMLSPPQDPTKFPALSTLSGFPLVKIFLCIYSATHNPKRTYDFAFWCCWRWNTTVPLKVFHASFKTTSVNAHTTESFTKMTDFFKQAGQLA